jgi:hypothetical protein
LQANRRIGAGTNFRLDKASPNVNLHAGGGARNLGKAATSRRD